MVALIGELFLVLLGLFLKNKVSWIYIKNSKGYLKNTGVETVQNKAENISSTII
jgi:hypothetical protein